MPDAPTSAPLVEARRLGRRAADGRWLLRGIDCVIHPGERLAVTGPTGSGKTLLLRAFSLLDRLDEGEVLYNGQPVTPAETPRYRQNVIYVHQQSPLLETTVEENLRFPFSFKSHRRRRFDRERVLDLLGELGRKEGFLQSSVSDLSGGERQIVALLRAIQLDPQVLLLDEPTSALDQQNTRVIEKWIQRWLEQGEGKRSAVWVSHDSEQTKRVADRFLRLKAEGHRPGE